MPNAMVVVLNVWPLLPTLELVVVQVTRVLATVDGYPQLRLLSGTGCR